jgi:hypothetical protein
MDATKIISGGAAGAGLGPAAVYVAGRFGAHLTSEDGALIAASAMAVGAFIAHNGIRGVWRILWHGSGSTPAAPDTPTA